MPDWLNWLSAMTGVLAFIFSIVVYLLERQTRRSLNETKCQLEKQQTDLKKAQEDLDRRIGKLRGIEELARRAETRSVGGRR